MNPSLKEFRGEYQSRLLDFLWRQWSALGVAGRASPEDQRDGTHLNDLKALHPAAAELEAAARWSMTHDVSEGFKMVLKELLTQLGHEPVAQRI